MPPLKNIRHEAFAQRLVSATKTKMTNGQCYTGSGYKAADDAAEACAARLLGDVRNGIQNRVNEIMEAGARRASVTVESLLGEYDEVRDLAKADKQHGVVKSATDSKGKLVGLLRDRVEVGEPGSFDQCQTVEDVIAKLLQQTAADDVLDVLDTLRLGVLEQAANAAKPVAAASQVNGNELAANMQIYHPGKKWRR